MLKVFSFYSCFFFKYKCWFNYVEENRLLDQIDFFLLRIQTIIEYLILFRIIYWMFLSSYSIYVMCLILLFSWYKWLMSVFKYHIERFFYHKAIDWVERFYFFSHLITCTGDCSLSYLSFLYYLRIWSDSKMYETTANKQKQVSCTCVRFINHYIFIS